MLGAHLGRRAAGRNDALDPDVLDPGVAACRWPGRLGPSTNAAEDLRAAHRTRQRAAELRLIRVKQGDVVKLQWSADRRTAIHLHGYDIEKTIEPGAVTDLTFAARATGRFTISPHVGRAPSGGHSHGAALVTIEVLP